MRLIPVIICLLVCIRGLSASEEHPNVLFVYLDDFGWKDASYMGSDFFETPHLDQLASEGMVFTNAYSNAANCAPARASLMSGQYTPRHRIFNVGTGPRGDARYRRLLHVPGTDILDRKIKTWVQVLHDAGYRTALMGKWHLSEDPLPYGFDINIGGTRSGSPPKGYYPPNPAPGLEDTPEGKYLTDYLSEKAVDFIRENKDRPWCLYLSHFAVHVPLDAKRELLEKYQAKEPGELHSNVTMATMIQAVDDGIGKIVAVLDELDLTDDTIIVFYSDNGGFSGGTDMAPLRGYKGTFYEGGIRVPFFVKWPGIIEAGSRSDVPIIGTDLYPTLCAMTGTSVPKGQLMDGVNLLPLFRGEVESVSERPIFWHFPAYLQGGGFKHGQPIAEQHDPLFRTRPCSVVRLGDWKLIQYFEDGAIELYNLSEDISETRNLSGTHPEKAAELLSLLGQWRAEVLAPVPTEPNPEFDGEAESAEIARLRALYE